MKHRSVRLGINKTFLVYLLSYTLAVCLPLIGVSAFAYWQARDALFEEVERGFSQLAAIAAESMTDRLREYQDLLITIGLDSETQVYQQETLSAARVNELTDLLKQAVARSGSLAQSAGCWLKAQDLLIRSRGIPLSGRELGEEQGWIDGAMERPDQLSVIARTSRDIDRDRERPVLTLSICYPYGFADQTGVLAVDLSAERLSQILEGIKGSQEAWIVLLDQQGTPLAGDLAEGMELPDARVLAASNDGTLEMAGQYVYLSGLEGFPLTIAIVLPEEYVTGRLTVLGRTTLAMLGVLLALGLPLACLLSRRMYHPVEKLANLFGAAPPSSGPLDGPREDAFRYISDRVEWVLNDNKRLDQLFSASMNELRERFVSSLLANNLAGRDPRQSAAELSLPLDQPRFVVALYEIDNYQYLRAHLSEVDLSLYRAAVKQVVAEMYASRLVAQVGDMDEGHFAVLINLPADEAHRQLLANFATNSPKLVAELFQGDRRIVLSVGVGGAKTCLEACYVSYQEAREALQYKVSRHGVVFYDDIAGREGQMNLCYGRRVECVINALKSGNPAQVERQLAELRGEIENDRFLPFGRAIALYSRLLDEGLEVCVEQNLDSPAIPNDFSLYRDLLGMRSLVELDALTRAFLVEVCRALESRRQADRYVDQAVEFIQANFRRNIGLLETSEALGITPAYLSRLFKSEKGVNLTAYLNEKRVAGSLGMLTDTGMTISEIALESGYNNVQSYIKFFKKYQGVTPSEYRRIHRKTP